MGDACKNLHDPVHHEKNLCHKFQRGSCHHGDSCARIHDQPTTPAAGVAPVPAPMHTPTLAEKLEADLKYALREQLHVDCVDAELDGKGRKRKWSCFYAARLHPDKWAGWPLVETVMSGVSKDLNASRSAYENCEL